MRKADAAVAVVRTRGPDPALLLIRRAERESDAWSGHWSLPGGRADDADVDLLHTAIRELHEECGIRLSREQGTAALPPLLARRRIGPFLLVAPFVFEIESELPAIAAESEVAEAMWIRQRTLTDPSQHSLQRAPGMPPEMRFPAISLPGAPLWGFTYRLLMDWLWTPPPNRRDATLDLVQAILNFLLSQGLLLETTWHSAVPGQADEPGLVYSAQLRGDIPAEAVLDHLSMPGAYVANVNRIEIRPAFIHIWGLDFEEYRIEAKID